MSDEFEVYWSAGNGKGWPQREVIARLKETVGFPEKRSALVWSVGQPFPIERGRPDPVIITSDPIKAQILALSDRDYVFLPALMGEPREPPPGYAGRCPGMDPWLRAGDGFPMSLTMTPPAPVNGAAPPAALPALGAGLPPPITPMHMPAAPPVDAGAPPDSPHMALLRRWTRMANIAEDGDVDDELERIAARVCRDFEIDDRSRDDWKTKYRKWLDFALQIADKKTYPWPEASNIIYPLMTTAAVQFAARAYPAIIRDRNVVKGSVVGSDDGTPATDPNTGEPIPAVGGPMWKIQPGAKQIRADLIGRHMSWQLLDEQEEWEPQTDRLLIVLPIVGLMYRKSYFASDLGRNVSETVTALDLCVNYYAKSFETAPRKTEMIRLYPWEIEEKIRAGSVPRLWRRCRCVRPRPDGKRPGSRWSQRAG